MSHAAPTGMPAESIRPPLVADHEALDTQLADLIRVFADGDWLSIREEFAAFERRLLQHLQLEETMLFPDFAKSFPREAEELLVEHQMLRNRVDEIGIGIDVHETRLTEMEELATLQREHAAREDRLLYRWVDATPATAQLLEHWRSPAPPEGP